MTRNSESTNNSMNNSCGLLLLILLIGIITTIEVFRARAIQDGYNRGKEIVANSRVSAMNSSQQAYFGKKEAFSTSFEALGFVGMKTEHINYKYLVRATKQAAFHYALSKKVDLRSYVGGVFLIQVKPNAAKNEIKTEMILCVADKPGTIPPLPPRLQNGKLFCGTGTTNKKK